MSWLRRSRERIENRPIGDGGIAIARCLLVCALRKGNLRHAIAGSPCVIGFVVEKPADPEAFASAGRLPAVDPSAISAAVRAVGPVAFQKIFFRLSLIRPSCSGAVIRPVNRQAKGTLDRRPKGTPLFAVSGA
jgi:hypothetical protein